ncbi:MAG TPA: hypothetical protein VGC29_09825, partial [Flavisolibacter sp.]
LIPPRPAGYEFTRELFKKRTGLAFDALSPAEMAADLSLSLLLDTERMNRMVEYELMHNGLGLEEMIQTIIDRTFRSTRRKGMEGLVQMQTEQIVLTYLLANSINDNASFITRSVLTKKLNELKTFIENKNRVATDATYSGHLLLALERMKKPENAKPTAHAELPPGAPIGCGL